MHRTMPSWSDVLTHSLERLKERASTDPDAGVRDGILASWRRSYDSQALGDRLDLPYDDNLNLSTRLVRAARPVIEKVQSDIDGSPLTLILGDSTGKVLLRQSGEPCLEGQLDRALLAPGFSYAEKYAGTNGIGTALEDRSTALVRGAEHFNEQLQVFACVGVPVRDPITRRQLGVLDITTWADRAHPALTALVRQAGASIEDSLLTMSSRGARSLLEQYLRSSRTAEDRIIAISDEAFIGSAAAANRIGGLGRPELWALTVDALGNSDRAEISLMSGTEYATILTVRAIRSLYGRLDGAIVEIPASAPAPPVQQPSPVRPRGAYQLSPLVLGPMAMLGRMAAARLPVCLVGEPGTGKRTLIHDIAMREFPGRTVVVIDCGDDDIEAKLGSLGEHLADGHPIIVRDADGLASGRLAELVNSMDLPSTRGWLTFTTRTHHKGTEGSEEAESDLAAAGIPMIALPPLRARVQDLRVLLPDMVRRLSRGRVTSVSPELLTRLIREPWPGNLAEVVELVTTMIPSTTDSVLREQHLPADFGSGLRYRLTPLEWMTRDAIVESLRACDWDKARAAEALGMSRASIYRKIKAYNIEPGA